MYTKKKIIYTTITILWVAVIFGFSMQPADVSSDISRTFPTDILAKIFPRIMENEATLNVVHVLVRKGAHFTEFGVLGVLCAMAGKEYKAKHQFVWNLLFCVMIAFMDEMLQLFILGREGRILDVMIDTTGAFLGISIVWLFINKMRKYEKIIKKI